MGAGHTHALYVHEHSPVHRAAPEVKLVAALGMVIAVAATPRRAIWVFVVYGVALTVLAVVSRIELRFVAMRLIAITPFVAFALFIPFVAGGEMVEIAGVSVSSEGLWAAWNVLAKAGLGATISILLTATTEVPDILRGLGILRVPRLFTSIAMFMVRYLEVISEEFTRVRTAMTSRGFDGRWLGQAQPVASAAGALFVRSYERGERVHAAMLSRGFTGVMPVHDKAQVRPGEWAVAVGMVLSFALLASLSGVLVS